MSFPYDGSGAFPQWETLHSPLDTPTDDQPTIDNTPILLHHPTENPQLQQRHRPRAPSGTGTPSIHPIDALIFSRPGSASSSTHTGGSSIHTMGMGQLMQQFASSPGSTPAPTAGPSSSRQTSGPVRTTRSSTTATASSHPYLRQTSSSSSSPFIQNIGIPPSGPTIMTRSKARKQSVKFADAPTTSTIPMAASGGMVERPATSSSGQPLQRSGATYFGTTGSSQQHPILRGTSSASPAPAQIVTSGGGTGQRPSPPQAPPQPSTSTSTPTTTTPRPARPKIPSHRFTNLPIHTDMSYSPQTHTLSCSLELPGVNPSHLRVSLGTCYFNHVKYVGVVAESVPVFGNESVLVSGLRGERTLEEEMEEEARRGLRAELAGGIRSGLRRGNNDEGGDDTHIKIGRIVNPNLRERKFGIFRRYIQVPSHTTSRDISANLKHGVLSLHIYCGPPFDQDDEEEVPVAFD